MDAARALPSVSLWDHSPARRDPHRGRPRRRRPGRAPRTAPVELRTDVVRAGHRRHRRACSATPPTRSSSRGQGLALAHRAGATLRDVEMVQFHPTALDVGIDPMPLVSEAVRGEGAILVNELGEWVLRQPARRPATWSPAPSGPSCRPATGSSSTPARTPASASPSCSARSTRPRARPASTRRKDLLPVRPAAHYHMGGVLVDLAGRSHRARAVRRRRGRLHRPARRQPAGQQLAARGGRLRTLGRPALARPSASPRARHRPPGTHPGPSWSRHARPGGRRRCATRSSAPAPACSGTPTACARPSPRLEPPAPPRRRPGRPPAGRGGAAPRGVPRRPHPHRLPRDLDRGRRARPHPPRPVRRPGRLAPGFDVADADAEVAAR